MCYNNSTAKPDYFNLFNSVKWQNFNGSIWPAGGNGIPLSQYSNFRQINVHVKYRAAKKRGGADWVY